MCKSIYVIYAFIISLALVGTCSYSPPLSIPKGISIALTEQQIRSQVVIQVKVVHHQSLMGQAVSIAEGIFSRHKCPYAQLTAEQAIKNGINVRLVADVIIMESGCKPHIFSPAGATGLMQIMPAIHHISVKALLDPAINIKVGTQYLALLVHKFGEREGLHHYLGMGSDDGNMTGDEYASRVISMSARRRRK